jgi:hypothetical protein
MEYLSCELLADILLAVFQNNLPIKYSNVKNSHWQGE